MKVGITGSSGVIGSALQQGLCKNYRLSLFDVRQAKALGDAPFKKVDVSEQGQIKGVFEGLDALIHLAGNPHPDAVPEDTYRNNFKGTSIVFEEARKAGVKKIVFASSNFYHQGSLQEALQEASGRLIMLDTPATPLCPYGESKVYGENLGRHLSYLGMSFAALRIGWTVPQDNPAMYGGAYMRAVFCSKRDLVQAFDKALQTEKQFVAAFCVSNNSRPVFDLRETRKVLGFEPQDDAENYFK